MDDFIVMPHTHIQHDTQPKLFIKVILLECMDSAYLPKLRDPLKYKLSAAAHTYFRSDDVTRENVYLTEAKRSL